MIIGLNYSLSEYVIQDTIYLPDDTDRARVMISNKGDRVALTLNGKGYASIFDDTMKKEIGRLVGHEKSVSTPKWSWNDRYIITVSADRQLILWDSRTYLEKQRHQLSYDALSVVLSCDGSKLITTGFYMITMFNVTDPQLLGDCSKGVEQIKPRPQPGPLPAFYIIVAVVLIIGVIA